MLTILAKLLKVLNSEQSPSQIAAAISLAAIIGLTPLFSLHNLVVLLIVLFFRVNLTTFLVAWPLFTLLGLLISPLSESVGLAVLQHEALVPIWESFYNTLVGRWSNFYYTGVMGSLIISIIFAVLMFPIFILLIKKYRSQWMQKLESFHVVKLIKATSFWNTYQS